MEFKFGEFMENIGGYEFKISTETELLGKGDWCYVIIRGYTRGGELCLDGYWKHSNNDWEWYWLEEDYGICDDPEESTLAAAYLAVDPEYELLNQFIYSEPVMKYCNENTYDWQCGLCGNNMFGEKNKNGLCEKCTKKN